MLTLLNPLTPQTQQQVITRYFDTLNAEDYQATAALFTPQGKLFPPFEEEIIGQRAIAHYLQQEAKGMRFIPHQQQENAHALQIVGKVHTSLFSVNVVWTFTLTPEAKIEQVDIQLLASPQELLGLAEKIG